MVPVRRARPGPTGCRRRADRGQHGQRVGLGIEDVDGARQAPPSCAAPPCCGAGRRPPCAGPCGVASLYCGPTSNSAGSPRPRASLRGGGVDQVGQDRGPHRVERRRRSSSAGADPPPPPPNRSACWRGRNDQVTASFMPRAPSARRASGTRRCSGVAHRPGGRRQARQRGRRDVVEAVDARHFLDQVGFADRCRDATTAPRPSTARCRSTAKPSLVRMPAVSVGRHVDRGQRLHAVGAQRVAALPVGHHAAARRSRSPRRRTARGSGGWRLRRPIRPTAGSMPRSKR